MENGNINVKSDAGTYVYAQPPSSPYQLAQINNQVNNISLNSLNITYNSFKKVSEISEANKVFNFTYGNDEERIKMEYKNSGTTVYIRYYGDNYDLQESNSGNKEWTYVYAPSGLCAIYYKTNGVGQLNYVVTDHLGSPVALVNNQQVIEQYSFDAWGRRRDPANWNSYTNIAAPSYMVRGFTMHEHLDEVGIINMNGRIYDPVLGRFLQTDNYIQSPDNLQNFNRYSYCYNNPLKYTDPSGNIVGVLLWPMGYICNLAGNLAEGSADPFRTAAKQTSWSMGIASSALQVPVYRSGNTSISVGIDPFAMGVGASVTQRSGDFTFNVGGAIGLGGFYAGGSVSYQSPSGFGISVGGGAGNNSYGAGASINYEGYGLSYYRTKYGASSDNPTGESASQLVGGVSLFAPGGSFRVENDVFAPGGHDRWRTNAWELTIGKWSIGSSIHTNDARGERLGVENENNPNPLGDYKNGQVYSAPLWVGYRSEFGISRAGFSHKDVQHYQQNEFVHRRGIVGIEYVKSPWFTRYDRFQRGIYCYSGPYNPYSLFNR